MPLYKRTSASVVGNITGFASLGCNPSPASIGIFNFSNSPIVTGSNQFSILICENNTIGGIEGSGSAFLPINLTNNYTQQSWLIKNNTIAAGENIVDGTHEEYFESEITSFVSSEGSGNFLIRSSRICIKNTTQDQFDAKLHSTNSGIKYEFIDSTNTKMKWTSKIEIIQNLSLEKPISFSTQSILDVIDQGSLPQDVDFSTASNNAIVIDSGVEDIIPEEFNNIEAGIDDD